MPVTFTFVSCYAIVLVCLTAWIGLYRGKTNTLRGEGQDPVLFKRSRFYGNLIENGPAMALVLGASEAMGLSAIWLWIAVSSFVAGRILYFVLYDQKVRAVPMIMTQFPAAAIGVWVILTIWS
ncbi:MAPEG family protein [Roseibium sp. TrichSKD4]|uniref:MAPEG family protein n=1 Tax=Roseibium sp. TrichSKD4 TaxID=744980 RepID=UPI00058DA4B3|nr:MAPEG family protein [Roseibium sp. TrichSKD4]